jgi:hypothetical protein
MIFSLYASFDLTVVQLSLEENTHVFRKEIIQRAFRQINLIPKCLDDNNNNNYYCHYYYGTGNDQ